MVVGALAFFGYCVLVIWLLAQQHWPVVLASATAWLLWLAIAFGLWAVLLR